MKEYLGEEFGQSIITNTIEGIKDKIYRYSPIFLIAYCPIYMVWFSLLEKNVEIKYLINTSIDTHIPFLEIFIIPYLIWFGYVAVPMVYFCFKSRRDFVRTGLFLCLGMTICLIIYTVFPHGIKLRPDSFPRNNIFTDLVRFIYSMDTSTNVCPSIHCLNSIGIHMGIVKSEKLSKNKKLCLSSRILMVLICMSTVFVKQHSIVDVCAAVVLSVPLYYISFVYDWNGVLKKYILIKFQKTQKI